MASRSSGAGVCARAAGDTLAVFGAALCASDCWLVQAESSSESAATLVYGRAECARAGELGAQGQAAGGAPGRTLKLRWSLEATFGWYDFTVEVESDATFRQQIAGHLENGKDSMTDPAIAT